MNIGSGSLGNLLFKRCMCIVFHIKEMAEENFPPPFLLCVESFKAVSYTHLTLPTILRV